MKPDNFTDIPQSWDNISMYVIRTCIWNAVQACAPKFSGHLLDVGCGRKPYRQFLLDNKYITEGTEGPEGGHGLGNDYGIEVWIPFAPTEGASSAGKSFGDSTPQTTQYHAAY